MNITPITGPTAASCDDCGAEPGGDCHWACSTRWPDTEPDDQALTDTSTV